MHKFLTVGLFALSVVALSQAVTPKAQAAAASTADCQWQFLYQEKVGNPSQYGTIIDWYGAVGQCPYSRKGYNHRTSSWMYI